MKLFHAQFRIQQEASEASGRHIPMVVENVRGAQKWVGRSLWAWGSFHLWGDVPALMPMPHWRMTDLADGGMKSIGHLNQRDGHGHTRHLKNPAEHVKQHGDWFRDMTGISAHSSKSPSRKQASAMIAKIPIALSRHIARTYYPR